MSIDDILCLSTDVRSIRWPIDPIDPCLWEAVGPSVTIKCIDLNNYKSRLDRVGACNSISSLLLRWLQRYLTHWGRVTHLCVSKLTSIASDNGLSPGRRQAIIWNKAGILLIGPLGTNFSEVLIKFTHFHWRKNVWKCRLRNVGHCVSASMSLIDT